VSSTAWGAQRVQELLESRRMRAVLAAGNGEIEVYELIVPEAWRGRTLAELLVGIDCAPVSIARGGRASLPAPTARFESGDLLQVGADLAGATALRARLGES
jgi:trk system potassium uptake protein TrkA